MLRSTHILAICPISRGGGGEPSWLSGSRAWSRSQRRSDHPLEGSSRSPTWVARISSAGSYGLIGLAYVFGAEDTTYKIYLLGLFALVALSYLSVGFWVVRHGRDQPRAEERP